MLVFSCNETKHQLPSSSKKTATSKEALIDALTLHPEFEINDVRRYGVFPDKTLGNHPNTNNTKITELLTLAESGLELYFPEGVYKTNLDLSNRTNLKMRFKKAAFTGAVLITGTEQKYAEKITLKGTLISYSSFFSKFVNDVQIDSLIIKNKETINISGYKSTGCSIFQGTTSLYCDYLEIEGTGSDGDQYRYTPAALMIHGKSPAPNDILIKTVKISSSDRHGAYLSGNLIEIDSLIIDTYAKGMIKNMIPIAYTTLGEEKEITGVWLNDFENSIIENLYVNSASSPKATDAIYLDSGNLIKESVIYNINISGDKQNIRKSKTTNVKVHE